MPGIHLYSSNRLETLADLFAELIHSEPLPLFQKETIIMQSRGMERWLAMETASRLNIWANCDCPFPNTFVRNIFKLLLPQIPEPSRYDRESLLWHLMTLIPKLVKDSHFQKVATYLAADEDLKLYQLSYEIADLFDQYTLFRPDMIIEWENSMQQGAADHAWQAILWRSLAAHLHRQQPFPAYHRARLLQLFEEKIFAPGFNQTILPSRVSIFGITSLPPYHLRVLAALARHIDLHFFIMNPCREYWFDIIADRDIVKISRKEEMEQDALHLSHGNSLLASMGHLGRDFMAMVQELYSDDYEFFKETEGVTLLAKIQQDILYLHEQPHPSSDTGRHSNIIDSDDRSLAFHSCHSPMREVEILHDLLLQFLADNDGDETVEPRDILVMAPEIDEYAPLIRAVFDASTAAGKKIPYTISDQSIRMTSKYIETFFDILLLPQSRFSSINILGILAAEPVKNRFCINDYDLATVENWIHQTRICWGIDQDHKSRLHLPPFRENTWRAGLDRLLLGYAMPGHNQILFENILPYDNIEGTDTNLLGNFLSFSATLFSLAETLQQSYSLQEWSEILLLAKDALMLADEKSDSEDRVLHRLLYGLRKLQQQTSFDKKVSLDVIRSFLASSLDERYSPIAESAGFLAGGVTFCSMLPMRAIPFKVICLMGLNDGVYPRSGRKNSFDLMVRDPKRGDRSKRYDDRYLFLETILSARKKLAISFVGQSVQDGSKRPPSVLVSELMDYLDHGYVQQSGIKNSVSLSESLTTMHHLQPFHPDYFMPQTEERRQKFFSYSDENCKAARALSAGQQNINRLFSAPLPSPPDSLRQVDLHELVRFFSHPTRYLLVKRIGIAPIEENRILDTSEHFTLKGLARYKLENDILEHLLQGDDCNRLYRIKKAVGDLPHGEIGKIYFTRMVSELRSFHKTLAKLIDGQELRRQQVTLTIGDFTVTGELDTVGANGLVLYRYGNLNPKDIIRSWINHLMLNSIYDTKTAGNNIHTYHASKDAIYRYVPVAEWMLYLEQLLNLYWQGLTTPLCFFPRASHAFARQIHKGKSEQEALHNAVIAWEGNKYTINGEKNDPYNRLCCKNINLSSPIFMEQARKVFMPALEHLEKGGAPKGTAAF